ncbi:MAG: recombinase family protein [Caedimonadaceae bacterium]|nr:MAG: recombinase family protein [Caedimonadaceae bacterium]
MSGKTIGYIRVSSYDQNPDRQLDGIHLDKVCMDKASGKDIKRPAFEDLLNYVREGDLVVVHSLDRLARNLDHLRSVVKELTTKCIQVKFLKENLVFTGDDSPMSNLLLSVMGAFAEFERSFIKERQMEGIALEKQRGAFKGRKKTLSTEQVEELKKRVGDGDKKSQIARDLNISRETLYQYLRD